MARRRFLRRAKTLRGRGAAMASTYYVAWWNVENLFDEEGATTLFYPNGDPRRTDKVARALGNSIVG
jgi:hypothetical protein